MSLGSNRLVYERNTHLVHDCEATISESAMDISILGSKPDSELMNNVFRGSLVGDELCDTTLTTCLND